MTHEQIHFIRTHTARKSIALCIRVNMHRKCINIGRVDVKYKNKTTKVPGLETFSRSAATGEAGRERYTQHKICMRSRSNFTGGVSIFDINQPQCRTSTSDLRTCASQCALSGLRLLRTELKNNAIFFYTATIRRRRCNINRRKQRFGGTIQKSLERFV